MKKLFLLFALVAFLGANTATKAACASDIVKVECEKCGGKDGKCTKECKEGKKAKCCKGEAKACSHGTDGAASTEGEAPKSCGSKKKSCCKSKAKAEANAATEMSKEETAPAK